MPHLYVVATPIGNLNDLTPRMREALENADLIAAEDTRVTMKLTQVMDIHKPMLSCHRHNEDGRKDEIVEKMLAEDLSVALTCDAGTPGISDPGEQLVRAAWEAGIPITPVSGPSAVITALSVSGFDTREFAFYGFLPRENKALDEKLTEILERGIPANVLYESPHRIIDLLERIEKTLPGARVCVCCDLTKKFERINRGEAGQVLNELKGLNNLEKGEYCLVLDITGVDKPVKPRAPEGDKPVEILLLERLLAGETMDEAAAYLRDAGIKRNELYRAKLSVNELAARLTEE